MQINVRTSNPSILASELLSAIQNGYIKTWKIVPFDHQSKITKTDGYWHDSALVELQKTNNHLIIKFTDDYGLLNDKLKASYLSEITEILLVHFNEHFNSMETKYLNYKKLVMKN